MHNNINLEMPYFIKPSINLDKNEKVISYQKSISDIRSILQGENNMIVKMSTINSVLKINIPYAYWIGFYCVNNGHLTVGPYQGTIGCTHIEFGKGVCGTVASSKQTKIVKDVHILEEGEDHITCDPNSQSEIVVPVFDIDKNLIAVFDVDSSIKNSFDEIDKLYLEQIMKEHFEVSILKRSFL